MSAGVAHEINNPVAYVLANLTALSDLLDELEAEPLEEAGRQALTAARDVLADCTGGMERIQRVASDLKLFSRVEYDRLERVVINDVVGSALKLASNELRHRARVEMHLGDVPPIMGDASKLSQVVLNLLINAAQAIESGDASSHLISIETKSMGTSVVLRVSDTGRGIRSEDMPHIFEPFFTTKPKGKGTGLGLWLVREIVRMHDGEIRAECEAGRTTFEVRLPAHLGAFKSVAPPASSALHGASIPLRRKARVLLIDDDAPLRRALKRMLSAHHHVVEADGGKSAIEAIERDASFDAILCDLMMPDLDGPAVYAYLEHHHPDLLERMAFLSGGAFTERSRAFLEQVTTQVVEKPVSREALLRVIDGLSAHADAQRAHQLLVGASK
jgi:CheY-like chemotaxis protein